MSAPEQHPAWQGLEPSALSEATVALMNYMPGEHFIELSKAISAKRTADALERLAEILGPADGTNITTLIYYLTTAIEPRRS